MRNDISFDELFNTTFEFRDCELEEYKEGFVKVKTTVNEKGVNPYGTAHGGYLYTLCDAAAGLAGYSLGDYVVTLQANMNYIKSGKLNDELIIIAQSLHSGNKTAVIETQIMNQNDELLCKGQFTLYKIAKV